MKTILNTTSRLVKVSLPLGKVLRLGPRQTGEIADRAAEHPPVARLVEKGTIEIVGETAHADSRGARTGSIRAANRTGSHPAERTARRR